MARPRKYATDEEAKAAQRAHEAAYLRTHKGRATRSRIAKAKRARGGGTVALADGTAISKEGFIS